MYLRRCEDGSGSSSNPEIRSALSLGVDAIIKIIHLFYYLQQIYIQMPNRLCKG